MKKLIKSSVFPRQIGQTLLDEIEKVNERVIVEDIPMKNITFEVNVSFSSSRNPICSIILDKGD